jgi:hypothetical protein
MGRAGHRYILRDESGPPPLRGADCRYHGTGD